MKQLYGGRLDDEVLRELFFKRLPDVLKTILIITGVTYLDREAEAADKLHERNLINAVSTNADLHNADGARTISSTPVTPFEMSQLLGQMTNLVAAVSKLTERQSRARYRNNDNRQSRSHSCSSSKPRFNICYFHYKFGDKGRKCKS